MERPLRLAPVLVLLLALASGAQCGDRVCDAANGECTACTVDCHLLNGTDDCIGDGACMISLGEDCYNSPRDCACAPRAVCRTARPGSDRQGCYPVLCGDGHCDGSENATSCCADCGCPAGEHCENGACCPLSGRCCSGSEQCAATEVCRGSQCVRRVVADQPVGTSCSQSSECASGLCVRAGSGSICCARTVGCCQTGSDCQGGQECTGFVCTTTPYVASKGLVPGVPAGTEPLVALLILAIVVLLLAMKRGAPAPPAPEAAEAMCAAEAPREAAEAQRPAPQQPAESRASKQEAVKRAIIMGRFTCPTCSKEITTDWSVCPYCGADLAGAPVSSGAIDVYHLDDLDPAVRTALSQALEDLSLRPKSIDSLEGFDGDLLVLASLDKVPTREDVDCVLSRLRAGSGLFLVGSGGADNSQLNRIAYRLGAHFNSDRIGEKGVVVHPTGHPVAKGVARLRPQASCSLTVQNSKDIVLFANPDEEGTESAFIDAKAGTRVLMAAREVDRGRALLYGDAKGLARDDADSRILLRNALAWLLRWDAPGRKR